MMMRRTFMAGVGAILAGAALLAPPAQAGQQDAEMGAFVEQMIAEAIAVLQVPVDDTTARRAGFEHLIDANFDLPLITKLVIGRYWRRADDNQREVFARVFREHILNVYVSQLGAYNNEKVVIKQIVARNNGDTIVFTEIERGADPALRLDWLVRSTDNGHRIIDVAAEGVSMMTTKRSEFTSVIARDGLDGLIGLLSTMNQSGRAES